MKLTAIILIILLLCGMLSVCAFASGQAAEESTQESTVTPEASATVGGSTFRLEWYHYIIPVVIIFAMTLFTSNSIKPLRK